jgi:hypothetical protein
VDFQSATRATYLGCSASIVLEAKLDNILFLLRVVFNGVLPVVGLAETSRCKAESLMFRLCLVYVPFYVGVLDD